MDVLELTRRGFSATLEEPAASAESSTADVFAHARQRLADGAHTAEQRRLLLAIWDAFAKQPGVEEWPCHRLPLLVHAAIDAP